MNKNMSIKGLTLTWALTTNEWLKEVTVKILIWLPPTATRLSRYIKPWRLSPLFTPSQVPSCHTSKAVNMFQVASPVHPFALHGHGHHAMSPMRTRAFSFPGPSLVPSTQRSLANPSPPSPQSSPMSLQNTFEEVSVPRLLSMSSFQITPFHV
jgi:hypothetical protein